VITAALLGVFPAVGRAQDVLTQEEALRLAFPSATTIERRTAFLTPAQLGSARSLAGRGVEVAQEVVTYYVGMQGTRPIGFAYFDVHRVRTLPEVVMIVVSPTAVVDRIEILSFSEPPEYRSPAGWLRQFPGRALTDELSLRRGIQNITGATLTSRAITDATRRVLALHRVIHSDGASGQATR
jgi:electron transport complex protein RnfG